MKTEVMSPAGKEAMACRELDAHQLANDYVRSALATAGYDALPMRDRDELYDALALILRQDSERSEQLVEELRGVLHRADQLDHQEELKRLALKFKIFKGCPECDRKPDIEGGHDVSGQPAVVCFYHEHYAVGCAGPTIDDAITQWNQDDWFDSGITRTSYTFT